MAKVAFSKLKCKVNEDIKTVIFNDIEIEVKQYVPAKELLDASSAITSQVLNDDNNFLNEFKYTVFFELYFIETFSNITFTDKQKEDVLKLYDLIHSSGLFTVIFDAVPDEVKYKFDNDLYTTIQNIYTQKNSALGILESVSNDYSNLNLDVTELQQKMADPNNLTLLKDVMTKLG